VAWAIRAGFFFVLDRTTGENLVTSTLGDPRIANHVLGIDTRGQIVPHPMKAPQIDGALVGPGSATNWPPPTFSPRTGLFYVGTNEGLGMSYLVDTSARPQGYGYSGGGGGGGAGRSGLRAIDYRTGETRWLAEGGGARGLLSTAGGLVFGADNRGGFGAFDDETGRLLWRYPTHAAPTNGPSTWMLDGYQFVIVAAQDTVYAFMLNRPQE
jgi:alcohol dehydrogenase (cytochrome c)